MGANQSRPSDAAINEKLLERLQALHMKDERPVNEKDGYVVVGGDSRMSFKKKERSCKTDVTNVEAPKYTGAKIQHNVSVSAISEWEKELMEDPKVQ